MMEEKKVIEPVLEEKPSPMFLICKRALEIKREISDHLDNGGELEDLSDKYPCFKPFPGGPVYF